MKRSAADIITAPRTLTAQIIDRSLELWNDMQDAGLTKEKGYDIPVGNVYLAVSHAVRDNNLTHIDDYRWHEVILSPVLNELDIDSDLIWEPIP